MSSVASWRDCKKWLDINYLEYATSVTRYLELFSLLREIEAEMQTIDDKIGLKAIALEMLSSLPEADQERIVETVTNRMRGRVVGKEAAN